MITLMILKNVTIFLLGVGFSTISLSLVFAYYLYHSEKTVMDKSIQFVENDKNGTIYWNDFISYKSALEAWYTVIIRHLTGSKRGIGVHNKKRARLLFILSPTSLLIILLLVLWLSISIMST